MARLASLIRALGHRPSFATVVRRLVWLDRRLRLWTNGRFTPVGDRVLPTLLITTTGRKSGQPRSQPLAYALDGEDFVVIASNWGQRHHPAWSGNLLANPSATVAVRGGLVTVRAELTSGAERARLWAKLEEFWPAFRTYEQRAAGRDIRVFRLVRDRDTSAR
jgi:deazaflavin-dependent oxidoreductase (nitroreductase family)